MDYRVKYSKKWAAYRVEIVHGGRIVQWAGWWGCDELEMARRWGRAAVASYNRHQN